MNAAEAELERLIAEVAELRTGVDAAEALNQQLVVPSMA